MATAKERRLARRAAEREGLSSPAAVVSKPDEDQLNGGIDDGQPPKKKKKHLTQRKKKVPPPPPPSGEPKGPKKKSAAQLRRNAERALARGEELSEELARVLSTPAEAVPAEEAESSSQPPPPPSTAIPTEADEPAAMNAKERRLARREAARRGEAVSEDLLPNQHREPDTPSGADTSASSSSSSALAAAIRGKGSIPYVVFVGQLPHSATAEQIKRHFEAGAEIPSAHLKVRVLTHADTGRSKGMAFVEVESAEEQHQALALHRSYFGTGEEGERRRQINVEKSSGGGRDSKRKRISEGRMEQELYMKSTVERIIEDYVAQGKVGKEVIEEDKHLKEMLHRCDAATVDSALEEFSERGLEDLSNPAAYLTALVCRKLAEGFDAKVSAAQATRAAKLPERSKRDRESGESPRREASSTQSGNAPLEKRFPSMRGRGRGGRASAP